MEGFFENFLVVENMIAFFTLEGRIEGPHLLCP